MATARRSTRISQMAQSPSPIAASKRKRAEDSDNSDLTSLGESDDNQSPPTKGIVKRKRAANAVAVVDSEELHETSPKKSPRKPRAPKPQPVYVIPDVERKETTYKGRLGYACLNTVLRNKKPATQSVFCSRTCRLDSLAKNGMDWVKDLGRKNVEDLLTMIQWNEDHHIRFLRVSSEMFPFASHAIHGYSLDYLAPLLASVGELANKYGHRLTTHPGQYTQLGSPKPIIVEAAVRELKYHCEMLDRMGVGKDGVMIVHGGGVYEDKEATLARIEHTITSLLPQNVRDRLVLENDEMCYTALDLLPLCERLSVPLVFDYHHDNLNPSIIPQAPVSTTSSGVDDEDNPTSQIIPPSIMPPSQIIARANTVFLARGIKPKQHLSEPRPGAVTLMERRAHSDRCEALPVDLPDDMDLMIEAKDKEQAVFHLYRMYGLQPVIHESLRPPDVNQTKETKGRKSNKRAKMLAEKGKAQAVDDDSE